MNILHKKNASDYTQKHMNKFFSIPLILLILNSIIYAKPIQFSIDEAHSSIGFEVKHFNISSVRGTFEQYRDFLIWDFENPENTTGNIEIFIHSVNTLNTKRDRHLLAAEFFHAEKFPKLTFKITSAQKLEDHKFQIEGDLTIRDVTKHISFPATFSESILDDFGNTRFAMFGQTKINREEFGIAFNPPSKRGLQMVGDEVTIFFNLELLQLY